MLPLCHHNPLVVLIFSYFVTDPTMLTSVLLGFNVLNQQPIHISSFQRPKFFEAVLAKPVAVICHFGFCH